MIADVKDEHKHQSMYGEPHNNMSSRSITMKYNRSHACKCLVMIDVDVLCVYGVRQILSNDSHL